jgi:TolB-like protein
MLVTAVGTIWWLRPGEPPARARPGIAVLPFANLGGDEATGRLADGLTEDTITDLAHFRDLDVIARNSVEGYKGKPADVRQVGKDLNVGYVLEGSVQRQADQIRVTAQLIDAASNAHLWSQRWDRPVQDVFSVQSTRHSARPSRARSRAYCPGPRKSQPRPEASCSMRSCGGLGGRGRSPPRRLRSVV